MGWDNFLDPAGVFHDTSNDREDGPQGLPSPVNFGNVGGNAGNTVNYFTESLGNSLNTVKDDPSFWAVIAMMAGSYFYAGSGASGGGAAAGAGAGEAASGAATVTVADTGASSVAASAATESVGTSVATESSSSYLFGSSASQAGSSGYLGAETSLGEYLGTESAFGTGELATAETGYLGVNTSLTSVASDSTAMPGFWSKVGNQAADIGLGLGKAVLTNKLLGGSKATAAQPSAPKAGGDYQMFVPSRETTVGAPNVQKANVANIAAIGGLAILAILAAKKFAK